jgi:PKHD-type hydroxylase
MLVQIANLFSADELRELRQQLLAQPWVDGKATAGVQSAQAKHNRQLDEDDPVARQLGGLILQRLSDNPLFMSAALPKRIYPPLFNRYGGGRGFGFHIDNAIRGIKGVRERVRTDLSATLFLAEPDSYDGGELVIRDTFGERQVKLPAGHLVLYPGSSVHRVAGDPGRAPGGVFLDRKPGARGQPAQSAAGHGRGDPAPDGTTGRRRFVAGADRRVPQPAPSLGRHLTLGGHP